MTVSQRIELFSALGMRVRRMSDQEMEELANQARGENGWFTTENVRLAFQGIIKLLEGGELQKWTGNYQLDPKEPKQVGVVMAGNIPLVGFHDLLAVLISGHNLDIKPSSKDTVLMKWLVNELIQLEPQLGVRVSFVERLNEADAIIATGSDNSARYFEYYFAGKPHIIRKNRTGCAILDGQESVEDLTGIGLDILSYFGLGCRNTSKLLVPRDFDFENLLNGISQYEKVIEHHKYKNNYDYNKSIFLVNGDQHFDTGFLLFKESTDLVSPISVVYFEYYNSPKHLSEIINRDKHKIQCITGKGEFADVPYGQTQFPGVDDYADGVDTLKFLASLN